MWEVTEADTLGWCGICNREVDRSDRFTARYLLYHKRCLPMTGPPKPSLRQRIVKAARILWGRHEW